MAPRDQPHVLLPYKAWQSHLAKPFTLSPLAIRAFTPVFDGLWRGRNLRSLRKFRVRGPLHESELRGKAPSPSASPPLWRGPLSPTPPPHAGRGGRTPQIPLAARRGRRL